MKAVLIYVSFEHKQIFWKKSVFLGAVSPVKGITRLIKCGGIFSKNNRSKIKKLILKKRENREIPTLPRWDFLSMKAVLIYVSFEHKQIFGKKSTFPRWSFPRKGNHTSDKMWRNLFENNRSKIKKTSLIHWTVGSHIICFLLLVSIFGNVIITKDDKGLSLTTLFVWHPSYVSWLG